MSADALELTAQYLHEKLGAYHLLPSDVSCGRLSIQKEEMRQISQTPGLSSEAGIALINQMTLLAGSRSWAQFCKHIESMAQAWLNCYSAGVKLEECLSLCRTLRMKRLGFDYKNTNFQGFLSEVMAQNTAKFDRKLLDYYKKHDPHTGLPNQLLLTTSIDELNSKSALSGLLILRLQFNVSSVDTVITIQTDLLDAVIAMLMRGLTKECRLFQLSSDEFAVLVLRSKPEINLDWLAARLLQPFEHTLLVAEQHYAISASVGVVQASLDADASKMLEQAKVCVSEAKRQSLNVIHFSEETNRNTERINLLKQEVINAFEDDRLMLYFQPIVDLPEQTCFTAEALIRCRTEAGDFIPPPLIIDTLYARGFGLMFTRWLFNSAARLIAEMNLIHQSPIRITLNLSADDVCNQELPDLLAQVIALWGIAAEQITLEITENGLLLNEEVAIQTLLAFRQMGCKIAIDDFGTGYSSLSRLKTMPIDLVKIDQSFVRNIEKSPADQEIVKAIVALAHGLGKQVVAEGVEDETTLELLANMGCEKIQGYFFSRPLSFEAFCDWLNQRQSTPNAQPEQAHQAAL